MDLFFKKHTPLDEVIHHTLNAFDAILRKNKLEKQDYELLTQKGLVNDTYATDLYKITVAAVRKSKELPSQGRRFLVVF